MKSPRIGITTSLEDGQQSLDLRYVQAVEEAGGIPVIVPLLKTARAAAEFAALLDGLVITGGPGITRGLIGQLPADLPATEALRDLSDELIYRAAAKRPVLGICYGMQFVNAMAGGTIYGDAQAQAKTDVHSADRGATQHEIRVTPGTRLRDVLNSGMADYQYPSYSGCRGSGRGFARDGTRGGRRHRSAGIGRWTDCRCAIPSRAHGGRGARAICGFGRAGNLR